MQTASPIGEFVVVVTRGMSSLPLATQPVVVATSIGESSVERTRWFDWRLEGSSVGAQTHRGRGVGAGSCSL